MSEPMTAERRAELRCMAADARAAGKPHDWPWGFASAVAELLDALESAEAGRDALRAALRRAAAVMAESVADMDADEGVAWYERQEAVLAEIKGLLGDKPDG